MKKILLFGGQGMLGRAFLGLYGMIGQDCARSFESSHEAYIIFAPGRGCDIANKKHVREVIKNGKPDIIINAAAYTNVDEAERMSINVNNEAIKVNVNGIDAISSEAKRCGAKLVHFSTDYVFSSGSRVEDDDEFKPINHYGETKLLGELVARDNCKNTYTIRTSWLFGYGTGSYGTKQCFPSKILQAAKNNKFLSVVVDEIGCPTFANDLVEATINVIENHNPGIYHLVNSGEVSRFDFAKAVLDEANVSCKMVEVNQAKLNLPAKRPKRVVLLNTKVKSLRDWRIALKEYVREII